MFTIDAETIGQYVIESCINNGYPITRPNLEKVLYLIQREYLRRTGKVLFYDRIYAGPAGPTIEAIKSDLRYVCNTAEPITFKQAYTHVTIDDDYIQSVIDYCIEIYGSLPFYELARIVRKPGGAWDKIYNGLPHQYKGQLFQPRVIPPELIKRDD